MLSIDFMVTEPFLFLFFTTLSSVCELLCRYYRPINHLPILSVTFIDHSSLFEINYQIKIAVFIESI